MSDYSIWVREHAFTQGYHVSGVIYGAHNQGYRKLPYCYKSAPHVDRGVLFNDMTALASSNC